MSLVKQKVKFVHSGEEREGVILEKYLGLQKIEEKPQYGKQLVFYVAVDFYMIYTTQDEVISVPVKHFRPIFS